jgi:DNA-binding NarL/FixJ family response regulator
MRVPPLFEADLDEVQTAARADMTLRVLMLEDREEDAELAVEHLKRAGLAVLEQRVDSKVAFERALSSFSPSIVLCDRGAPQYTALHALRTTKSLKPALPIIILTGALHEESLVACCGAGADDVVLKSNLGRLAGSVRQALERRTTLHTLSPRQLEVLLLVVQGSTTREIADKLGLSLKTAETHRITKMKRLGIHDVAGLVRYAVKVRLIAPEG